MKIKKTGIIVKWSETPDVYERQARVKQHKGRVQGNVNRTFKGDEGFVEVRNMLTMVRVHSDGRVEVTPHEQLMKDSGYEVKTD